MANNERTDLARSRRSLETAQEELRRLLKDPKKMQSDLKCSEVRCLLNMVRESMAGCSDPKAEALALSAVYEVIGFAYALGFRRGRKYGVRQTKQNVR